MWVYHLFSLQLNNTVLFWKILSKCLSKFSQKWDSWMFHWQIQSGIPPGSLYVWIQVCLHDSSHLQISMWCWCCNAMLCCSSETKSLRDEEVLQTLPVGTTASFYFSDLGPQLTWGTVSQPTLCLHTVAPNVKSEMIPLLFALSIVLTLLPLNGLLFAHFACFSSIALNFLHIASISDISVL